MLIDGVAYLGNWPFRPLRYNTAETMLERMDRCGIDCAVVSSLNAVLYQDVMNGNRELAEAVKGSNRFIPLAVINPAYPHWREDFAYCLDELGMKGLEVFPGYHNYSLDLPEFKELLEMAAQRKVPVRLPGRLVDIRGRHWMDTPENLGAADMKKIIELSPETDFMICSCNTAAAAKTIQSAQKPHQGRILYDFSRLERFSFSPSFQALMETVEENQVYFGTCSPFQYPEVQQVKLYYSGFSQQIMEKILAENLLALFNHPNIN